MRQYFRSAPFAIRHRSEAKILMHIGIRHSRLSAFSLVELLTVIFIIALLIAILIPALNKARNAAKKVTTAKAIESIKVGLELFKGENGPEFPQTNGYPPSFSHPPIVDSSRSGNPAVSFRPELGEFPFLETKPEVTGAHWLPAMLMGPDKLGFVQRSAVPNVENIRMEPWKWYTPDAISTPSGRGPLTRAAGSPYVDVGGMRTLETRQLPGRANQALFADWGEIQNLPVIVDAFDQPILYYAANTHGRQTNMVEDIHEVNNDYGTGAQHEGPPYYFHQDNKSFTGIGAASEAEKGWDFGGGGNHWIARSGADLSADSVARGTTDDERKTFARYIIDRKIYADMAKQQQAIPANTGLRPVNHDSFLLISAGVDGLFGSPDDVSNMPAFLEQ